MSSPQNSEAVGVAIGLHGQLKEAETISEQILQDKNLILEYQKRMAANRELLSKYRREEGYRDKLYYVYLGGFFVKLPGAKIQSIVKKDQDRLKEWIELARRNVKNGLRKLQQIRPSERPRGVVDLLLKESKQVQS
mmetsp:Transcript_22220/g.31115  ORF Transcript_22220/g.31115 Transcript_22220/m.31115 type:complete len:136 (-) Transcript_22220:176-583(-)